MLYAIKVATTPRIKNTNNYVKIYLKDITECNPKALQKQTKYALRTKT